MGILREKRRRKKERSTSGKIEELAREGWSKVREERKMETLDFSCSSRKREEVDGKALASDKTVLSSLFLSFSFFFVSPYLARSCRLFSSYVPLSPLLPRRIFVAHSNIVRRSSIHFRKRLTAAGRNVDGVSKRV